MRRGCGGVGGGDGCEGRWGLASDGDVEAGPGFDDWRRWRWQWGGRFDVCAGRHGEDAVGEVADAHVDADDSLPLLGLCALAEVGVVGIMQLGLKAGGQVGLGAAGVDACGEGDAFELRELQA